MQSTQYASNDDAHVVTMTLAVGFSIFVCFAWANWEIFSGKQAEHLS